MGDSRSKFNFEQGKAMLKDTYRDRAMMQFSYIDEESLFRESKYMSVENWFNDWWGEHKNCPSNDTTVLNVSIGMTGCEFSISECITFGSLMEFISKEMRGDKPPKMKQYCRECSKL